MKAYGVLGAVFVMSFAGAASAQQVYVTAEPPPPPRVYVQPAPYYGPPRAYARPVYGPGDLDRPRLRLAFGGTGGVYIGDNLGGAGGLWGQAGVQINRLIAVYYQTHAMLGLVGARSGGADSAFFGGIWLNEVMVDFTIQDVFQVGIGPAYDVFSVNSFTEGFFGADLRLGVALGNRNAWRRGGFFLGVDIHPTFITDSTFPTSSVATSVLLTLGGGLY